jgi:hypothetical protein
MTLRQNQPGQSRQREAAFWATTRDITQHDIKTEPTGAVKTAGGSALGFLGGGEVSQ